ncbi:MAG: hypothetical protein V1743_02760 [Nanoarchaeota archaeon]
MPSPFTEQEYQAHLLRHQILVVDDEERKLWEVVDIALANGFYCSLANSAPEAWEKLTASPTRYELMVCDKSMPTILESKDGYDYNGNEGLPLIPASHRYNQGLQLLRRVRSHPQLKSLDVIIYTSGGGKEQTEALGATYVYMQDVYELNEILRQRSELYREAVKAPEQQKKDF